VAEEPLVGQGLLITEASRSHSDTPQPVGLLWTGNQPVAEIYEITQHSKERDTDAPREIRTHYLSRREATDPRLRPRGHWNGQHSRRTGKVVPLLIAFDRSNGILYRYVDSNGSNHFYSTQILTFASNVLPRFVQTHAN